MCGTCWEDGAAGGRADAVSSPPPPRVITAAAAILGPYISAPDLAEAAS